MAGSTASGNTIRNTLLNFKVDPKSKEEIEKLTKQFEKLERSTIQASKQLKKYIEDVGDTAKGRAELAENAKHPVNTQRKILNENQKNARALLDQISLTIGKGLNPQQQQELMKGLNQAFGEITGRFTKQAQTQAKKQAKQLEDYYNLQFRNNPTVPQSGRLYKSNVRGLSADQLQQGIASQKLYQKGAKEALKEAIKTGDTKLEKQAQNTLRSLESGLVAANKQLDKFTEQAKKAEAAQSAQVKTQTKTLGSFREQEFRLNPTVARNKDKVVDPARVSKLGLAQLEKEAERNRVLTKAANNALKEGYNSGNKRLETDAGRALEKLEESTKAVTKRLTELRDAAKEAARAEKREAEKVEKRVGSLDSFYQKQFQNNPTVKRRNQINPNAVGDFSQKDLQTALASQKLLRKGASDALKEAQKFGDTSSTEKFRKQLQKLDAGIAAAEKQLKKFEESAKASAEQNKQSTIARKKIENATLEDYNKRARYLDPTVANTAPLRGNQFKGLSVSQLRDEIDKNKVLKSAADKARKDSQDTNPRLRRESSQALKELKKSTREAQQQIKLLGEEAKRAANAEKAAQKTTATKSPVTEQQRVSRRIEQIKQSQTNQRLDGGAQLFRNQGQLLRNYAVMGAGVGGLSTSAIFSTELDRQFKQLQSIVNLTNEEMEELSTNLIDVSEKTKFTATDVADAAITLGQAGLGQNDITNAIEGVTLFATAVGSDLKSAVDLATSTLGVFNKDSAQMTNIVDKMTTAVNNSKLNLDKLALGLQYSGNLAAQSNITFEETVSTLGAMANSGIRAGSTLGTGLRQIIISLQKPSESFTEIVHNLGLSMADLDITTHGLIPVMKTLAENGFTVRDAMESMEVRAASAYGAFANNISVAEDLSEQMRIGGSAGRANETQMGALANQLDRLGSISKSIVYESLEPLLDTITALTEKTADFLSVVRDLGPLLGALAVPASILGGILATRSVLRLGAGLLGGMDMLTGGKGKGSTISRIAKVATGRGFGTAAGLAARAIPGVGLATAVGTAGVYGYQYLDGRAQANDRVDSTQAALNRGSSQTKVYEDQLKKVGSAIDTLILKQNDLTDNKSLQREIRRLNDEFRQQGLYIDDSIDSYDKLISKMKDFENATRDGVGYLQKQNRNNFVDNSQAKLDELFSIGFFDSSERKLLATESGQNVSVGSGKTATSRGRFASRGNVYRNLINTALPNFGDDLAGINDLIRNINPKEDGAYGRAQEARKQTEALQSQLFNILNQSPQELDSLMEGLGLSGDARKEAEEYINNLATEMLNRANTLLEVENNQKQYNSLDPELKKEERRIAEIVLKNRRELLKGIAETSKEINALTEKNTNYETSDYLGTFKDINKLVNEQVRGLLESEKNAIAELDAEGVANPKLVLQEQGYYQAEGEARSTLESSRQLAASYARPDANLYYPARLAELDKEIDVLRDQLRQVTDRDKSDEVKAKLKETNLERETVADEQDTLFSAIDGNSPIAVAQRDRELNARVTLGNRQFDTLQEKTFARSRLERSIGEQQDLDVRDFKLLGDDDELSRLLSDVIGEERAAINNDLQQARQDAEQLRTDAGDIRYESERYLNIAGNEGYTDETRARAAGLANELETQAVQLEKEAIALEEDAVKQAKEALMDFAEYLQTTIVDNEALTDGRSKAKTRKSVEDLESQNISLDGDLTDLAQASKEADRGLRDFRKKMGDVVSEINPSVYESAQFRKTQAVIYGTKKSPLGEEDVDENNSGQEGNGLTSQLGNAGSYIVDEVNNSYKNFDGLTQMTIEATEAAKGLGDAFGNTFADILTGAQDAKGAFKALGASILTEMANIATRALANQLISSLFSGLGLMTGGMGGMGGMFGGAGAMFTGGPVIAGSYKTGGLITTGMETRDSTYAKVSRGEFVLRKAAVDALGLETVKALNSADPSSVSDKEMMNNNAANAKSTTGNDESGTVNVYVVSEKQLPPMGPNDVKAIIGDDIAREGEIASLIAQVNMRTR